MKLTRLRQSIKKYFPQPLRSILVSIKYRGARLPGWEAYKSYLTDGRGIEIGGPSTIFETQLPVYQAIHSLDGVNFAAQTIWEGAIKAKAYRFHAWKKGRQYIADATSLAGIPTESYDFLLSSNCLEHVANPLKALGEWRRVLKSRGAIILVLPNKKSNFDHRRPVTTFQHLLDDYQRGVGEDDLTHVDEILGLHDLKMDLPAGDLDSFKARSLDNFKHRALHHHIFDLQLIQKMFEYLNISIIDQREESTDFIVLGVKND